MQHYAGFRQIQSQIKRRMDPFGTLEETFDQSEKCPLTTTRYLRVVRKDQNHYSNEPPSHQYHKPATSATVTVFHVALNQML